MKIDSISLLSPLCLSLIVRVSCQEQAADPVPIYMEEMLSSGRRVYDKFAPPKQAKDEVSRVRLAMYIEGMSSFRTQTMDFQLDVYFQQYWHDNRLAHNETTRILIRDRKILNSLWLPDVYFANARMAEYHEVTQPNFLLWIWPNGSVLYDTRVSMTVVCTLRLQKWPLDSQKCNLRILSYAYTTEQLIIEWIDELEPITKNDQIAMSDMSIEGLFPGECDGNYTTGTWSCVTAEFRVKREITHHIMQSYVPTTLIVVISWFSFWLDCEAGGVPARVSLAITTLLTLSTQASAARMALPEVSYMKAIDTWMGACMIFLFSVMIEFTVVNFAQRQVMASSLESMADKATNAMQTVQNSTQQISSRARNFLNLVRGKQAQHHQLVEAEEHVPLSSVLENTTFSLCRPRSFPPHSHLQSVTSPLPSPSSPTNSAASHDAISQYDVLDEHHHRRVSSAETPTVTPRIICDLYKESSEGSQKAARLANWQLFDTDNGSGLNSRRESAINSSVKLIPDSQNQTNYGSTEATTRKTTELCNNNHSSSLKKKKISTVSAILRGGRDEKSPSSGGSSKKSGAKWMSIIKRLQAQKKNLGRERAKNIDQMSRWLFPLSFALFNLTYWWYYLYYLED